jgi:hypothetical protein
MMTQIRNATIKKISIMIMTMKNMTSETIQATIKKLTILMLTVKNIQYYNG